MSEEKAEDTSMPPKHTYTVPVRYVRLGKREPLPYDFDDASTSEHPDVSVESNTTGRDDVQDHAAAATQDTAIRALFEELLGDIHVFADAVRPGLVPAIEREADDYRARLNVLLELKN